MSYENSLALPDFDRIDSELLQQMCGVEITKIPTLNDCITINNFFMKRDVQTSISVTSEQPQIIEVGRTDGRDTQIVLYDRTDRGIVTQPVFIEPIARLKFIQLPRPRRWMLEGAEVICRAGIEEFAAIIGRQVLAQQAKVFVRSY